MRIDQTNTRVVILGAGVGGLSAAYFLQQQGIQPLVLEKSTTYGGLARSFRWNDVWCDFAAHRLFTQDQQVLETVKGLVPLHEHQRRSRIFLAGSWMRDPIDVVDLATHLPPRATLNLLTAYLKRDRNLPEASFEDFVLRRYGRAFYDVFFRSYTERLFSLEGSHIDVEWARRKVRLASPRDRFQRATKTKFQSFFYPVHGGYGAIATALYETVRDCVVLDAQVTSLDVDASGNISAVRYRQAGVEQIVPAERVISTLPLTLTARLLGHSISLNFQKVDAVYVHLRKPQMTENHWLYFMDDRSAVNRLVEFKQMSPDDTDPATTVVCAEVTKDVADPTAMVVGDLVRTGLITPDDVLDTKVIREPFAYPRYEVGYPQRLREFGQVLQQYPNLHLLGRAAQFEHLEVDDLIGAAHSMVHQLTTTAAPTALRSTQGAQEALVWVVVLAWNNYADTAECLASLRDLTYGAHRVVLVDNGSTDGTPAQVRASFPEVVVLENGANLGVPAGYNVGFRYALEHGADHVFMLNNDTRVDPGLLEPLVEAAQEPGAGILHPIVYYYDSPALIWSAGARYRGFPPAIIMEKRVFAVAQRYHELEYAISCGLLIPRRAFEQVGLFDENYRFLWDDLDFSERVRRGGLRILQVPGAKLWHKISRTTKPGSALFWQVHGESGAIFYRRHSKRIYLVMALHLGWFALREFALKWRWRFLKPFLLGLRHGLRQPLRDVPQVKDGLSYPG